MACSSPTRETTPKLSGCPAPFFLYSGSSIAAATSEATVRASWRLILPSRLEPGDPRRIAMAGLFDDDHIEARGARVEIFDQARDRHNPDRHGTAALGHFPGGFRAQQGNTNAVAFADPANGVEPADQRLALAGRSAASLRRPGAAVDEVDGHAAKLFAEFFTFGLQGFERNIGAAIEFVVELAPNPGCRRIARRFAAAVHAGAISNGRCPGGRGALQFGEQRPAEIQIGLTALQFQQALVGVAVRVAIFSLDGLEQMADHFRSFGGARGKFEAAFQFADFFFELEQLQFIETRVEDGEKGVGDGFADAHELALRADDRGLFGEKFLPAKAEVGELLLEREPGAFMPAQAVFDGIAVLHERLFHFLAHMRRGRSPERGHLAVPTRGKLLTEILEVRQFVQGMKVLGPPRARVIYFCRFDKLAPGFMSEERE